MDSPDLALHALIAGLATKVWCAMDEGNDGHIPLADDVQQLNALAIRHFEGHRLQQELLAAVEAYQQWCMAASEIKDLGQEYMYMMRQEFILLVDALGAKDASDFATNVTTLRADRYFGIEQETLSSVFERRDAVGQSFSDSASVRRFKDGSNYAGFAAVPCFHPYQFIPKQDAPQMVIAVPASGKYLERLPCGILELLDNNGFCNVEIYIVFQLQRSGRICDGPNATYLFRPQYFFLERDDKSNPDTQEAKYPEAGHSDNFEVSPKMAFFFVCDGDVAQLVENEQRLTEQERAVGYETAEDCSTVRTTATKPMQSPEVLKNLADRDLNEICYSAHGPNCLISPENGPGLVLPNIDTSEDRPSVLLWSVLDDSQTGGRDNRRFGMTGKVVVTLHWLVGNAKEAATLSTADLNNDWPEYIKQFLSE